MEEKFGYRAHRILCVITGCGGGDWPPLLALAEGLCRRGHELLVVCDRDSVNAVQASGLTTLILPQSLELPRRSPRYAAKKTRSVRLSRGSL